jgi:hypothetical protein
MDWLVYIEKVFNNQSVGAFVGAAAAFMLVALNDWRRDLRKVRNIRGEIEMNLGLARSKLETVRKNRDALRTHNKVIPAPILKFNTTLIRELAALVLDRLTPDQRRAIEGICYNMEATDKLLESVYNIANQFRTAPDPERIQKADQLLQEYGDTIVNLKRIIEMCDYYLDKRYSTILTKQYNRSDYEEQ